MTKNKSPSYQLDCLDICQGILCSCCCYHPPDFRIHKSLTPDALSWPDLSLFCCYVEQCCSRNLSFECDVLDAFAGVAAILSHSFSGGFCYGLPELFFDIALLWQPQVKFQRIQVDPNALDGYQLPSWFWVGWRGRLDNALWLSSSDYLIEDSPTSFPAHIQVLQLVHWHKLGDSGPVIIHNCHRKYRDLQDTDHLSFPPGWSWNKNDLGGFWTNS